MRRIVDLELAKAMKRTGLTKRRLRLQVTPGARDRLAELGFHPKRGARPLKRVIEERVVTPLAVRLARHPRTTGRDIHVLREDGDDWRLLSEEEREWAIPL